MYIEFHVFILHNVGSLWEDFEMMYESESNNPGKVIVDFCNIEKPCKRKEWVNSNEKRG